MYRRHNLSVSESFWFLEQLSKIKLQKPNLFVLFWAAACTDVFKRQAEKSWRFMGVLAQSAGEALRNQKVCRVNIFLLVTFKMFFIEGSRFGQQQCWRALVAPWASKRSFEHQHLPPHIHHTSPMTVCGHGPPVLLKPNSAPPTDGGCDLVEVKRSARDGDGRHRGGSRQNASAN